MVYSYTMFEKKDLRNGRLPLNSGFDLIWKKNEAGGRTYSTDELGATVMDTCLTRESDLHAALYVSISCFKSASGGSLNSKKGGGFNPARLLCFR